jgi:divalent metal cation (Fe/Co/Zn/Cd) transporter
MFFETTEIKLSGLGLVVMALSIAIDTTRYKVLSKTAKKYESQALEADALHFSSDILGSAVVIFGLLFVELGMPIADPLAALGVASLVIIVSIRLGKRAVDLLVDKAPAEMNQKIEEVVKSFPEIQSCSRLRIRRSGASIFVDMNICLDRATTFEKAHQIASQVEEKISALLPRADVMVHTDPVEEKNFIDRKLNLSEISKAEKSLLRGIINAHIKDFIEFHDLSLHSFKNQKLINFHLVLPKDIKIEEAHQLCDHLEKDIMEKIGSSKVVIHVEPCNGECKTCRRTCEKSK